MEQHFILSDKEFEEQFESGILKPELFSHEAHLRLAWIHITKYGQDIAINNISKQLINFVELLGARQKYNHTLTIAAIKAVAHFINKSKSENFVQFISEFPRLKNNFKELMSCHYQIDIFNSEKAKDVFLEPDLMPFD
jgi:hypothetical protein